MFCHCYYSVTYGCDQIRANTQFDCRGPAGFCNHVLPPPTVWIKSIAWSSPPNSAALNPAEAPASSSAAAAASLLSAVRASSARAAAGARARGIASGGGEAPAFRLRLHQHCRRRPPLRPRRRCRRRHQRRRRLQRSRRRRLQTGQCGGHRHHAAQRPAAIGLEW